MTRAIYLRTSTSKQDLSSQLTLCRAAAGPDALVFEDAAISGKRDDRQGIKDLIEAARRGEVSEVYVLELSRIGRSMGFMVRTVEELSELGIPIILAKTGTRLDARAIEGVAMLGAFALSAEVEHALILERSERARLRMKEMGIRPGPKSKMPSMEHLEALILKFRTPGKIAKDIGVSKASVVRWVKFYGFRYNNGSYYTQTRTGP